MTSDLIYVSLRKSGRDTVTFELSLYKLSCLTRSKERFSESRGLIRLIFNITST